MCNGFGGFYSKDNKVYFATPDDSGDCSHSLTATRMPEGIGEVVAFEIPDWSARKFCWDTCDAPSWADSKAKKICLEKLKEVKPIWAKFEKANAPALAEFKKAINAAWAEFDKVRDAEWAEFEKDRAAEWAEFEKVRDAAWAESKKAGDATLAEYEKVKAPASAEFINQLKKIDGYCAGDD